MRLLQKTSGELFYRGKNIFLLQGQESMDLRKKMQIIFQDPFSSLNPRKTIESILSEAYVIHKAGTKKQIHEKVLSLCDMLDIPLNLLDHYPHELDGGMRQVSSLDPAYCVIPERERVLQVQRWVHEVDAAAGQPPAQKEAARMPQVLIDGPIAARGLSSRLIPFFGKAQRILDMTSAGQEARSDNLRIRCWVDAGGIVKFAMVEKSSGASRTDGVYLNALKSWRFSPRRQPGVFDTGTITFIFE